ASILFSIFALRGIPHVVQKTCGWLHNAAGRADRFMRWGLISGATQLLALFAGLPFGVTGIAWAFVVSTYILFLPAIAYSGQPLGIGVGKVVTVIGPQTIGALAAAAMGFALRDTVFASIPTIPRAVLLTISYSTAYSMIVVGLFGVRTPL